MSFSAVIKGLIARERGYVDHPSDKGGPTKDGITEAVARANGWTGKMQDLPASFVEEIYLNRYIKLPRFDLIYTVSQLIGDELIDTGVNMGPGIAKIHFQRLLNAFNGKGTYYADLFVDGNIGPISVAALRAYLAFRKVEGEVVFVKALNHVQGSRYLDIAENNESQEDFFYGWIKNRT